MDVLVSCNAKSWVCHLGPGILYWEVLVGSGKHRMLADSHVELMIFLEVERYHSFFTPEGGFEQVKWHSSSFDSGHKSAIYMFTARGC